MTPHYDIAIIGAGIAGTSIAAFLESGARIALLEGEDTPGYHTTGRSAAFWDESYGGPLVQPLTTASGPWLRHPPAEFGGASFLKERGSLTIARADEAAALVQMAADFAGSGVRLSHLDEAALRAAAPMLTHDYTSALAEPDCADIDVAKLHSAFLKVAKGKGTDLLLRHRVTGIWQDGAWHIDTISGGLSANVIVNAAGAWASEIAAMAGVRVIPITPLRRTVVQIAVEPPAPADAPLLIALDGSFYVKPEGNGRLWLSPHDETPDVPRDCAAEEIDIAVAIERLEHATHWRVTKVERAWAGLRNFAPDRMPVIGTLPENPAFFWFAGQGGWGIQTAPAAAMIAAAVLDRRTVPAQVAHVDVAPYLAARFA
jgi:D-arginine dehydrogenase